MTAEAGELFEGLDRFECRKKLVNELENQGFLEKIEDYEHSIRHCYRCSSVIEPILSDQWFLKMQPLAEKAIDVVKKGKITFYPKKWEKDYLFWMDNIRDWCISRQLWWGHRIPVWYCDNCGEITASLDTPDNCLKCGTEELRQDEDVLDTWFSSWLWPFSTLNWPEDAPELKYFYPTDVLVSGYDILFFWIARMIMAGLWFMEEIPYGKVYVTPMIKDEEGKIMSKSLGNSIDPIEMIEKYGADSVRFSLVSLSTEGQDIKLSPFKFELGRNFGNKIWNAFRFLKMKEDELQSQFGDKDEVKGNDDLSDKWIISRLHSAWKKCDDNLKNYRLNDALNSIYEFLWHDYCDWYVELLKNRIYNTPEEGKNALDNVAMPVFKKTMELLHPFMPFLTEEIWQNIPPSTGESIMIADPGNPDEKLIDKNSEKEIELIQQIVYAVRNIRGEMNVPPSKRASLFIKCSDKKKLKIISAHTEYFKTLGGIDEFNADTDLQKPKQSASAVLSGMEIFIPLAGLIDIDNERKRLGKEIDRLQKHIGGLTKKLSNRDFLEKAKKEVVEKERNKLDTSSTNLENLKANLNSLEE
ncbi:MAG: valine--tRNA ligase, partial [bacterium]|nr:valine--tRNA ligase [bacterium]